MRKVFIPILVSVIVLLVFYRWISFLDIQGIATIVAAVLSGFLTYCIMAYCGKRRLWLEMTLKEFQAQIVALAKETDAIKGHSIASISVLAEIKKDFDSYEKEIQSAIGVGTQNVLQSLRSLRDDVEGKTDLVKRVLSSLDDSLMKDMAGIVSRLDEIKGLSDLIPGMQERVVSEIGESARQTADEIHRVQSGLSELDKACSGISEQILKSAAELASSGNAAADRVVEEVEAQVSILDAGSKSLVENAVSGIGQSFAAAAASTASILERLESLKVSGDGVEKDLVGVSARLDEIKGLSDLIPGMQERIISEIGESKKYCNEKISTLDESICNKMDSNANNLFNRIHDDIGMRVNDLKKSYDDRVDTLEEDFYDYFKEGQEQVAKRENIDNTEIKILADIERLIKEEHE